MQIHTFRHLYKVMMFGGWVIKELKKKNMNMLPQLKLFFSPYEKSAFSILINDHNSVDSNTALLLLNISPNLTPPPPALKIYSYA